MARRDIEETEEITTAKTRDKPSSVRPVPRSTQSKKKTTAKAPKKSDLWLEKQEAKYLSLAIQFLTFARYGVQPELPDEKEQEHLAHVLFRANDKPPFSWVQSLLRRVLPMADPDAKPGRSVIGDLSRYSYAWHKHNPELYLVIMAYHEIYIPFINGIPPHMDGEPEPMQIPPRNLIEGKVGRRLTDEEWSGFLLENYGITPQQHAAMYPTQEGEV